MGWPLIRRRSLASQPIRRSRETRGRAGRSDAEMDLTVSDVDRRLVERACSGEQVAFAELFATLREPLLRSIASQSLRRSFGDTGSVHLGGETSGSGEASGGR